jgi:hypothetical protein
MGEVQAKLTRTGYVEWAHPCLGRDQSLQDGQLGQDFQLGQLGALFF